MLLVRTRLKQAMDYTLIKNLPGALRHEGDDAQDARLTRHPFLLRLPRSQSSQESVYVWMFKLEGGPFEREDLPAAIQQELREL